MRTWKPSTKNKNLNFCLIFFKSRHTTLIHSNVIQTLGIIERTSESILIAIELARGGNLWHFLSNDFCDLRGDLIDIPYVVVLNWFAQILNGLGYLHSRGVLHGDLTAANILIDVKVKTLRDLDRVTLKLSNMLLSNRMASASHMAPEVTKNFMCQKSDVSF